MDSNSNAPKYRILERYNKFEIQVKVTKRGWFGKEKVRWVLCNIYGGVFNVNSTQLLCPRFNSLKEAKDYIDSWNIAGFVHYHEAPKRHSGRTTKLANLIIDELFRNRGDWVAVEDHHGTLKASQRLAEIIIARLFSEHGFNKDNYKININNGIIYMKIT